MKLDLPSRADHYVSSFLSLNLNFLILLLLQFLNMLAIHYISASMIIVRNCSFKRLCLTNCLNCRINWFIHFLIINLWLISYDLTATQLAFNYLAAWNLIEFLDSSEIHSLSLVILNNCQFLIYEIKINHVKIIQNF